MKILALSLIGASLFGQTFDDRSLCPAGLESICAFPATPVFNVITFGAKGTGIVDDTVPIRAAIEAARVAGSGFVYFPTGTYAVAPQSGDGPVFNNASNRYIFKLKGSNLVLIGDGPENSKIVGYMPGLANPVTTWTDISATDDYARVRRFGMFAIDTTPSGSNGPLSNIQFRSLTIEGQAGYTGDFTVGSSMQVVSATPVSGGSGYAVGDILYLSRSPVANVGTNATFRADSVTEMGAVTAATVLAGGKYSFVSNLNPESTTRATGAGSGCSLLVIRSMTGDGWDITHKAIHANGPYPITGVLVFNSTLSNWRGEIIFGPNVALSLIKSKVFGTNASALSTSGNVFVSNTVIGGLDPGYQVYNGFENFAFPGNTNVIQDSTVQGAALNGIAFISYPTGTLTVQRTVIDHVHTGIQFSEAGHNILISGNTFSNNANGMITTVQGLYPELAGHQGFDNLTITGNTFDHSGSAIVVQEYTTGSVPNLKLLNNTVTNGALISGGFGKVNVGDWGGFVIDGNVLGVGATDLTGQFAGGHFALWTNTTRPAGTASIGSAGKFDQFSTADVETTISPKADRTRLNANNTSGTHHYAVMDPLTLPAYPVGFKTTFIRGTKPWTLKADPAWNDFAADLIVPTDGLAIVMGASGKFSQVQ